MVGKLAIISLSPAIVICCRKQVQPSAIRPAVRGKFEASEEELLKTAFVNFPPSSVEQQLLPLPVTGASAPIGS
jgi:hypothetical protein